MLKCSWSVLCLVAVVYSNPVKVPYNNGLSLELDYFFGDAERSVTRTDMYSTADPTWKQYFTEENWDSPPSTYRFGFSYNKPFVSFLAAEAGVAFIHTDEYSYSRYANYTAESFTENLNSLTVQAGLLFQHRFSRLINMYLAPSLELANHFASYHYETTPPSFSAAEDERQIAYQFRPGFIAKSGVEFIPGGKNFGISLLGMYRISKMNVKEITILPNRTFSEEITFPNFAIGFRCSFYLQHNENP
jgi:hypothetical protein